MASSPAEGPEAHNVIVKADEVDQLGANITPISDEQLMAEVVDTLPLDTASDLNKSARDDSSQRRGRPGGRPELRSNAAVPPPPMQPPPPAPGQQGSELSSDSLSLAQLKRIVQDIPGTEQRPYAFSYADCQSFPEELDEWFQYSEPERMMLLASKMSFDQRWQEFCEERSLSPETSWIDAGDESRKAFVKRMLESLHDPDMFSRIEALETICYTMAGVWGLTGGKVAEDYPEEPTPTEAAETPRSKSLQIKWIVRNVILVHECGGLKVLFDYMRSVYDKDRVPLNEESENSANEQEQAALIIAREREANLILTCMYFIVEVARREERTDVTLRNSIEALQPSLPVTLVEIIARLRWDDSVNVPFTRVILLFWKSILLIFGGSDALQHAKKVLEPPLDIPDDPNARRKPFLTASPLDYHIFRQEIISKYPAYNPPPSVFPLEPEHNSILPPLPNQSNRPGAGGGLAGVSTTGGSGSILNQSVHIATPAPSPPPSPVGPGGKLGKKQNYQTNQHFPFMYPPMDEPNEKPSKEGASDRQDKQAGKKWEGSGVPASIVEAGKLFASRVKMTRATRQLWEERDRFMKFERGWNADEIDRRNTENESDIKSAEKPVKKETDDEDVQRRLDAVEAFYRRAMPHLQSLVIVLLKVILTNVSAMVNQQNSQSNGTSFDDPISNIDELDMIRLREITSKAVSGSLLLLLKWFKRSHILKFEYMTQLLLDSNYLPLILKMFAHQDVDTMVSQKNDRKEYSFFRFCVVNSDNPPDQPLSPVEDSPNSEDEAVPPPIPRRRASMTGTSSVRGLSPEKRSAMGNIGRAEDDDLAFATDGFPKEPITTYSFRNFFSAINYLHIMQKITRDKAHRCLLLVQYKSSTILRKLLKIPDPHLQLYTLKLFKSQVPYCGRKWRQSNMRVITAIYLFCRPELRDDWLAGSDVDAEVEEALPLEQALRGLTHWWHLRQYKDIMNIEEGANLVEEERDFFTRELEAMGWGLYNDDMHNEVDDRDQGPPVEGTEWDGEPMQSEGW